MFMPLFRKISLVILSVLTGALFLYSGFTKTYSIEGFERFQYTIVEYVNFPWSLAVHSARILVGMEFALGALMVAHLFGHRKWVLKAAMLLLLAFSIYLVYLWAAVGNDINCGCFGDKIWMSPASSLIKNIVLLLVLALLHKYHTGLTFNWAKWTAVLLFIALTVSPYFYYPMPPNQPAWLQKDKYRIDLEALYTPGKADAPKADLSEGKHVVAFVSLTCPHCKIAAYKMHIMKEKNPSLPFHIVYAGSKKYLRQYWKETNARNIPHTRLTADEFTAVAGYSWPAIFMINNGMVEAKIDYVSMNQVTIEQWLVEKQPVKQ